jgi:predicted ArsR family transcriptional regulator
MSESRKNRVPRARVNLDAEIAAMVERVRQIFDDEILAAIYDRARNAAIRQARVPTTAETVPSDRTLRLVSNSEDDGFLRALRDELDRALTHH